jgi:hypothetical protein
MAITGKFAADFSEFTSAVQSAEAELRAFESDAAAVQKRLNTVSDSFSGRRILSEAQIAVKAVEEIGGATNLTAKEQERVNRLVSEAIEKYGALGKQAPDDMLALQKATESNKEPVGGLSTGMIALGTSIGTMAAEGVIALGKLAVDGIGAAAAAFGDLVMRGGDVSDIAGNFETLAGSVGQVSGAMLGTLREGTHGTISDFELMKTANEQMAAGLVLSEGDMKTLAAGAFNLAQATGSDVKEGLDQMSAAMVTGNAKSVALLTGKLDLESAERRYALSLGKTREELTPAEGLYARQQAILEGVAEASRRVGEQSDGISEKIEQAAARWNNFYDALAKTVAESPVLTAALDAIMSSLGQAFGGDQQALVDAIAKGINTAAIGAADFGLVVVEMARGAVTAYGAIMVPVNALVTGIVTLIERSSAGIATMAELAAAVPGVGAAFEGTATAARSAQQAWAGMRTQAEADLTTTTNLVTGQGALHGALNTTVSVLSNVKSSMVAAELHTKGAGSAIDAHAASSRGQATATADATAKTNADAAALKAQEDALKKTQEEQKKMAAAMVELNSVGVSWKATVDGLDQGLVAMAEAYIRAGAQAGAIQTVLHLTDSEIKAITESIKAQDKATDASVRKQQEWAKAQLDAAHEARGLWDEYEKIRDQQTKTATDQQIAEVERWKRNLVTKHQEAGDLTEDLYTAIEATAAAKLDAIRVDWQSLTTASGSNLQQTADKALATYNAAREGHHGMTLAQIDNLERIAIAAQEAASGYSTSFTEAATTVSGAMNQAADDSVAAIGRVKQAGTTDLEKITGVYQSAGARAMSGASGSFESTSLVGVAKRDWQKKATEAGGTVMYDTYNNPYIYIPGVNSSSGKTSPDYSYGARRDQGWDVQGMAAGGPVSGGTPYVVGERGPELFVPRTDGHIAPNGAGGISVVVQVQGAILGTADQLARLVGDALVGRLRQQGVRLPASV